MNRIINSEPQTLLPVTDDYVFAKLFGSEAHPDVLIDLLNAILNGHPHVKSIAFKPTEMRKIVYEGKSMRLDVVVETDDGTRVNIEMQCGETDNIMDRSLCYQANLVPRTLKKGQDYSKLQNTISIWICSTKATNRKACISDSFPTFQKNNIDGYEVSSEKQRSIIIELTKLDRIPDYLKNTNFSDWMQFIIAPLSKIPCDVPAICEAMEELKMMSADEEVAQEYRSRIQELNDYYDRETTAVKRERKKWVKKEEKWSQEKENLVQEKENLVQEKKRLMKEKIEMIKNMLSKGLTVEQAAEISGLSIDEIKTL